MKKKKVSSKSALKARFLMLKALFKVCVVLPAFFVILLFGGCGKEANQPTIYDETVTDSLFLSMEDYEVPESNYSDIVLNSDPSDNSLDDDYSDNVLSGDISDNSLGSDYSDNVLNGDTSDNSLGSDYSDNVLSGDTSDNSLGSDYSDNVLGSDCSDNVLGSDCSDIISESENSACDSKEDIAEENVTENVQNNLTENITADVQNNLTENITADVQNNTTENATADVTENTSDSHTHFFTEVTCKNPATCIYCGITTGSALGHDFAEATCTKPSTCTRCGATEGTCLGHNYSTATCAAPATCLRCKATIGDTLPHNYLESSSGITGSVKTTVYTCTACGTSYSESEIVITESDVYSSIMAMQADYPEGMPWTDDNYYVWNGGIYYGGYGCAGFAFLMSDAAFGSLPARYSYDVSAIRAGDILKINDNTHSVIVLSKNGDTVTVAEGNYNGTIHWGRSFNLSETPLTYIMTRYPE